jgi:hypothetical protein
VLGMRHLAPPGQPHVVGGHAGGREKIGSDVSGAVSSRPTTSTCAAFGGVASRSMARRSAMVCAVMTDPALSRAPSTTWSRARRSPRSPAARARRLALHRRIPQHQVIDSGGRARPTRASVAPSARHQDHLVAPAQRTSALDRDLDVVYPGEPGGRGRGRSRPSRRCRDSRSAAPGCLRARGGRPGGASVGGRACIRAHGPQRTATRSAGAAVSSAWYQPKNDPSPSPR